MKYCLTCTRKIPLMAGKCPYCLDTDQNVYGRLLILLVIIAVIVGFSYYYTSSNNSEIVDLINSM